MSVSITASVGKGGVNKEPDVKAIQQLLNKWVATKIPVTGKCSGKDDDLTVKAIKEFQLEFMTKPDGKVDKNGTTLKNLNSNFKQLPQTFGQVTGYYQYGSSSDIGKRQWGTEKTIETLTKVSRQFQMAQIGFVSIPFGIPVLTNFPPTLVGIGDVSFKFGGKMAPHGTHKYGKNVDLRPCRLDKAQKPVTYTDTDNYDQVRTKMLIELFLADSNVKSILFNDPEIVKLAGVSKWDNHDNHFHITMRE